MKSRCLFGLFALTTGSGLWAQQAMETPVFRVSSTQIVLEFIAIDEEGRFVTDLQMEELELKVDGKPHPIDRLIAPLSQGGAAVMTPAQATSQSQVSPGSPLQAGEEPGPSGLPPRPNRTVILLDTRVLDSSNFSHSVRAIRSFIEESLQSRHLVMLAEIDRGLEVLSPFTNDEDVLLEAVDKLRPSTVYNPLDPSRLPTGLAGAKYFQDLQRQVAYLRSGLRFLCQLLSGFPGRKHVVFFSEGYPMQAIKDLEIASRTAGAFSSADDRQAASRELGSRRETDVRPMVMEIVGLANSYGITFYTIDARGLVAAQGIGEAGVRDQEAVLPAEPGQPQTPTGRGTVTPRGGIGPNLSETISVTTFQISNLERLDEGQNTLLALAAGTNGSAFFNTNDLESVLRASTLEQRFSYLLSFAPKSGGKPKFHDVRIKSSRKDVIIRGQVGYQDLTPQDLTNLRLATALERPELFHYLKPVIQFQPDTGNRQVVVGVAGNQISGRQKGEQFEIEVIFVGQIYDEKGKQVSKQPKIVKGFRVALTPEQFQSLANQPLLAGEELDLKKGKYRLILVVMDQVSGAMGTRSEEFRIG